MNFIVIGEKPTLRPKYGFATAIFLILRAAKLFFSSIFLNWVSRGHKPQPVTASEFMLILG